MLIANRYLYLILGCLLISGCGSNQKGVVVTATEAPPRIPTNLYWDVESSQKTPGCSKPIQVIGDYEDCYKELVNLVPYVEAERCYRLKQLQQIVWVSSAGAELVKLPEWCK